MTLISRLAPRDVPIVIGDVLLSSERRTGLRTNLPLVGDINQVLANRGAPFEVSFAQKVNILSDRLVVAWAGPMDQAERALRILSNAASSGQISNEHDFQREWDAIDRDSISQLQLVGILVTDIFGDQIRACGLSRNTPPIEMANLGAVHAAGSGREEFIQLLAQTDWTIGGAANEHLVAHTVVAALVNKEYRQGGTIDNRWGGGYEAATFVTDLGRFQKCGDVLHTFWKVDTSVPDTVHFGSAYYKTTYWRDALILRSARFDVQADGTYQLAENSLELIPPLLRDASDYDLEELGSVDFSHKVLCCHVDIETPSGRKIMHILKQPRPDATLELQLNIDKSGRLDIPGEVFKMVSEGAQRRGSRIESD
jgi:hypothetical protein